ncbi:MAG: protein kinase [Sandaracinaceae bacterium]|nr:protein kinase [Sandaracinaceae bacterium]
MTDRPDEPETVSATPGTWPPPSLELTAGSLLAGKYRIGKLLGEGGMGQVRLATDEALDREVAIKLIRPDLVAVSSVRADFLAEARAMARLVHPNVVGVYAVGELDGVPYLVMEYIPGRSLAELLRERRGALGIDEATFILDQVCRGLAAMHMAGLVHRDVKPANVLIGPAFRVAIGDLGIARVVSDANPEEVWASGTPAYMAPEVRLATDAEPGLAPRADIFGLGVLAYQLLTGKLPYRHARVSGLSPPTGASVVAPHLPPEVDAVIDGALELYVERRTHSADAFRRALVDALRSRPRADRGSERILVADDDPSYRDLTARILSKAFPDATIEVVPDGAVALEAARRALPDLVVSDLDMPGMGGEELVAALRALPGGDAIPILLCTAVAGPTDWRLLTRVGVDGFVAKPFEAGQLVVLARAVLEARGNETPP